MRLLIITQVIDTNHPILGFFHRWVQEFAKHCEHVHVICLEAGKHSLPANVTIHSLGKEKGLSKFGYLLNFYRLIWSLRQDYDHVFVHMNQIYVILGTPLWKLLNKKVGLWYAHGTVSLSLRIATLFADKIFTASPDSFKLKSEKVIVTGHGIDTDAFKPNNTDKDIDLITVGRIAKAKNLQTLIAILAELQTKQKINLTIAGTAVTDEEKTYQKELEEKIKDLNLEEQVSLVGKVSQSNLPDLLNRAKGFVTVAQNGSLDKAILEAMAVGLPIVSMAPGSKSLPIGNGQCVNNAELIQEIKVIINTNNTVRTDYHDFVKNHHGLSSLITNLLKELSDKE